MTKPTRWVLGGERIPPKIVLILASLWTVAEAGWVLVALSSDLAGWRRWVQGGTAVFFALYAVYYWALYVHVHRVRR